MADDVDMTEVPDVQEKKKRVRIAKSDDTADKTEKKTKGKGKDKGRCARCARSKVRTQPKTVEEFYAARARAPELFTINDKGELVVPPVKEGVDIQRILTLPTYRELTTKEKIELEVSRREKIAAAEEAVQEAQHKLRETLLEYRNGDVYASDVVLANIEVMNREKDLQAKAWHLREVEEIDSIDTNKVLLDMPYEERKMAYSVYKLRRYPINFQEQYVSEAPLDVALEEQEVLANPTENESRAGQQQQQPMTAADRGRLGGILKIRRKKF